MNRIVFVVISSCVFLVPPLIAQKSPQKRNGPDTDDEVARHLTDVNRQWLQANMTHDPSILERNLAADYQIMRPTGRFTTKVDEIARVKGNPNSSCKLQSDHLDDIKVRVFGDVAVVYGWETFVAKCADKVKTGHYFWSDVWLQRSGRWRAVAGIEPDPTQVSPLLPSKLKPVAASGASRQDQSDCQRVMAPQECRSASSVFRFVALTRSLFRGK